MKSFMIYTLSASIVRFVTLWMMIRSGSAARDREIMDLYKVLIWIPE